MSRLAVWRTQADEAVRELADARRRLEQEGKALEAQQERLVAVEEARAIVQAVAQRVQSQVYERVAGVVSRCLEAVFNEPYELAMDFELKRGRTEVRIYFRRDGLEIDPLSASGGGVVDVASFALRLAGLLLSRPPLRRTLVLDEPFKFVSAEYRPRVRELLETLSREMGLQILMVTHIEEFKTGKVVEL